MSTSHAWPEGLDDVWAKSSDRTGGSGEGLITHTWRVIERLRDLADLRPDLPDDVGEPRLWHRLFWACAFHDIGKASPGFQHRLRDNATTSLARQWGRHRHEVVSLAFAAWAFPPARPGDPADPVARADRRWVASAIASHHRDVEEIESLYPDGADDGLTEVLASISAGTIARLRDWLADVVPLWASELDFSAVYPVYLPAGDEAYRLIAEEGANRARSLLRDYRRWYRELAEQSQPCTPAILLRGLLLQADHTASAHTRCLHPVVARQSVVRAACGIGVGYPHQEECALIAGSAVLTAPTGSGKTEAALLWATRQVEVEGKLPRLFYALPYQASMNAMFRRLQSSGFANEVGLQHGRALLALHRFAMEQDSDPRTAAQQARWRANLARLSYYPVRVFSPYQMLKALYRLKAYEAMLLDYHGASFIFDEIHAYEPERLGLILAIIEHLRAEFKARFLVMSATLPPVARRLLALTIGPHVAIQATAKLYEDFRRHRLMLLNGDLQDHLDLVVRRAQRGMSVLVCCNTVQRAQDTWQRLRESLGDENVVLLHGRFNGRDRLAKESKVHEATGVGSGSGQPLVVVATQVVEVSLNIDLDTIFTDPAPLEALIQRFGRINRRCQRKLAPVHVFREPADGQHVYDEGLVLAGLAILERVAGKPIDEAQIQTWLDEVYQGSIGVAWEEAVTRSWNEGRQILRDLYPFQSDDNLEKLFDSTFDSVEVVPRGLLAEYEQLKIDDPIQASSLMVPISDRRLRQLWHLGVVQAGTRPPVIDVPYSDTIGLDFSSLRGSGG